MILLVYDCFRCTGKPFRACTTSGMAYKMHGRVGDSPIIGAGLFVDNEIRQLQQPDMKRLSVPGEHIWW